MDARARGALTTAGGTIQRLLNAAFALGLAALVAGPGPALGASVSYQVGAIREISAGCGGQNAEVEEAVDPSGSYVYEDWIGCNGIGFARSTDGGVHFGKPKKLPGAGPLAWDPALAVASDGTVYAAFMVIKGTRSVPVVLASFDHGASFHQKTVLHSPRGDNWGDRDFIATGPGHTVYLTWDYGPASANVKLHCFRIGSCAITAGEVNIVMQVSTNGAKSFGPMIHVSRGFPAGGAESAPLVIESSGKIDVLYAGSRPLRRRMYSLGRGHSYFTSSLGDAHSWSRPVEVGHGAGSIAPSTWWIDGAIGSDAGGNLYATWDTQGHEGDVGWLSYSTDHGATWSSPVRVSSDGAKVAHIVQVTGGPPGIAYAGWLSDSRPHGYAEFLRTYAIGRGWLSRARQISRRFGDPQVWPGDTFGIAAISPNELILSWGSATPSTRRRSEIFAAPVAVKLPTG